MDTIATMTSIALQYGVPLNTLVDKFSHTRFEPAGFTNNREIPIAKSMMDYVFRYLGHRFLKGRLEVEDEQERGDEVDGFVPPAGGRSESDAKPSLRVAVAGGSGAAPVPYDADAPSCSECGSIMVRNGTCYKCSNCGSTSGCS
jgi:ribonucleoside-diphosphate reductase alpha chain